MYKITIIAVGKIKDAYWKDAENEYLKRLQQYAKMEIIELKEEAFTSTNERAAIQKKEAALIEKHIPQGARVIALSEDGKTYDSIAFAQTLDQLGQRGDHIVFIIGGPLGVFPELKKRDLSISLSQLTFPHQMVRPMLAEQIYRACTILKKKQYHY
ncbi:MAG: 23S rRNA (pseudouridine(1915)-N(3))-methyltransferase RlmH [Candidatus Magasanikbacteria bacterium]|jgi:23S rRNA (pseudouridine1915-N3)-methyltransferase|nr:23S rRNA (pseudouridine(1915)-N(3))-methyltransferase RlmH [Candidatus Magasanikbacteria bacterium]